MMARIARIAGALCVAASFASGANDPNPIVNLGYASYKGIYKSKSK